MEIDNVFDQIRPEFFFMVSGKTYAHLCSPIGPGTYRLRTPFNYLFRILFDCEVISEFDDNVYMPWGTVRNQKNKVYDLSKFYLLKVRPKSNIGVENKETFQPNQLLHFVRVLSTGKDMDKFMATIEKDVPGAGHDIIRDHDLSPMTEMHDITMEQIVPLFELLTRQKNFNLSGFITSAQLHEQENWSSEVDENTKRRR